MTKQNNVLLAIKSMETSFSVVEKKIAAFIAQKPETVINMTVAQLAIQCEVAQSSIVRFSQNLGFEGFMQLKINLAFFLKNPADIIMEDLCRTDRVRDIVAKVFGANIRTLENTAAMLEDKEFEKAVDKLCSARLIVFYGIGSSSTIAQDAYYRFMRIGLPASVGLDPHVSLMSSTFLTNDCVAIGISHSGRTLETLNVLKIAKQKGATVISITSTRGSPITKIADINLVAYSSESEYMKEAFEARIGHIALLDSLYACVALKNYEQSLNNLETMAELLNANRLP